MPAEAGRATTASSMLAARKAIRIIRPQGPYPHHPSCASCGSVVGPYQYLRRNSPLLVKLPRHLDRETPLAVQHFRSAGPRSEEGGQIRLSSALLLNIDLQSFHRIGSLDWKFSFLIGTDQRSQYFKAVMVRRSGLRGPKAFDLGQSRVVIGRGVNRANVHVCLLMPVYGECVNPVILGVSANEFDESDTG